MGKKKFNAMKFVKGSISILLAVVLTGVLSVASLLVEVGRYQAAKQMLDEGNISSALSILASFDSDLEKRFGLFGVDEVTLAAETYFDYLNFNSDGTKEGDYAASSLSQFYELVTTDYDLRCDLANYQVLKRQMLEYEKYRGPLDVTAEMLDIEKMLDKLLENIVEAIPGLEMLLTICDAIADLMEALKALYCLYKDVQQLQMTIKPIGSENNDIGDDINQILGLGWELVETAITGEEWPSHDPTYEEAYNSLKTAINNKVTYMKNTPKPPDPGPKPTDDVEGLKAIYEKEEKELEKVELLLSFLERAEELEYFDEKGLQKENEKISDLLNTEIIKSTLQEWGLTDKSTRKQFKEKLNTQITSLIGSEWTCENSTDLTDAITEAEDEASVRSSEAQQAYTPYITAKNKLDTWERKQQALEDYEEKLTEYNSAITEAKSSLDSVAGIVAQELADYKESLTKVTAALDKASQAVSDMSNVEDTIKIEKEDEEKVIGLFDEIIQIVRNQEAGKAEKGITFLNSQRDELKELKAEDVDASYKFSDHFNTGRLYEDGAYFMTKKQATGFCASLAAINLFEDFAEGLEVLTAIWELRKVLSAFPSMFEFDCTVTLNQGTTSILPSKLNGGNGSYELTDMDTAAALQNDLMEISAMVDPSLQGSINAVSPSNRLPDADLTLSIADAIDRLQQNLSKLMGMQSTSAIMGGALGFVMLVVNLFTIVETIMQIIDDFILIFTNLETAIKVVLNNLGEGLLLSQYAITKFPNRTSDTGDGTNSKISGYVGDTRQYFPDNDKEYQTFSGAHVEYIIAGSNSEIANQTQVFWTIFLLRAINNIVVLAADPEVMEIVGACNIAAPLVYILWVYIESNIDMNMLVNRMKVPLIKLKPILSPSRLVESLEDFKGIFESYDEENASADDVAYAGMKLELATEALLKVPGFLDIEFEYKDYLWLFLYLVPNKTKVLRMADLIQMEMRYAKQAKNTDFQLKNVYTYVKTEATASFKPFLPLLALGDRYGDNQGHLIETSKYVGY